MFEIHLFFLQKLDEEAEGEDGGEAKTEIKARSDGYGRLFRHALGLVPPPVNHSSCDENDEIGDGFIELGGMAWCQLPIDEGITAMEDESPSDVGRIADDFGIHQVAETDAAGGGGYGDGDIVHYHPRTELHLAPVEEHGDDESDGAAMRSESLVTRELP